MILYALKMDYENAIDENADPDQRPIGKALNKMTNQQEHRDKVNELAIKHSLHGSIKEQIEKNDTVKFNGVIIKRRKAERIILHYFYKAGKYYTSRKKTKILLDEINTKLLKDINESKEAFLLEFFLHNHYDKIYVGLSEHAVKLIMASFLFILDGNNKDIINVVYKALTKEIIDIKTWSKPDPHPLEQPSVSKVTLQFSKALGIAKDAKEQYELYKEETITSEFESLIFKIIKDAAIENGRITLKRKIRSFFRRDK